MTDRARQIFVISDLHLGGPYPTTGDPEDRGFRICTHGQDLAQFVSALAAKPTLVELVVNGDMVDFLAEEDEAGGWSPFVMDSDQAARKLDAIIDRDRALFDAMHELLERGHALTILLGNHDIELALPAVRRRLEARLGVQGRHDYRFIYDGEAYAVGRALIEHGNRYDQWNVVDYDGLRRMRSLLSRNQPVPPAYVFQAPAGSHMVAEVINPIKSDYRLIDLLKPERGAALPILAALEPGYRKMFTRVAALGLKSRQHRLASAAMPSFGGDIHAGPVDDMGTFGSDISGMDSPSDPLRTVLAGVMDDPDLVLALGDGSDAAIGSDISTFETVNRSLGLAKLMLGRNTPEYEKRLPALLASIRCLQNDNTFARGVECYPEYAAAAEDLSKTGFDYVVFGHTHSARDIRLAGGARYFNSGTWADLIQFPKEIVSGAGAQALDGLRAFLEDVRANRLSKWISFMPTYVRLDVSDDGRVLDAALCEYTSPSAV